MNSSSIAHARKFSGFTSNIYGRRKRRAPRILPRGSCYSCCRNVPRGLPRRMHGEVRDLKSPPEHVYAKERLCTLKDSFDPCARN